MLDIYKILGCTPDTANNGHVEYFKTLEDMKSYPLRFKLSFSPDGPESRETEVKLSLQGLNNVHPIAVRLGKNRQGM